MNLVLYRASGPCPVGDPRHHGEPHAGGLAATFSNAGTASIRPIAAASRSISAAESPMSNCPYGGLQT
jgi:hypothetical protein